MGARVAAHIANAGYPVLLLDIVPSGAGPRNRLVAQALEDLKKSRPAAFADPAFAAHVSVGNFEDDLEKLKDYDWVLEAVAENIEIKRQLLARVAAELRPDAILTTNTSGLPVGLIGQELPSQVRRHWFGTHFFNPPRYMRLLEIIATEQADPEAIASIAQFADRHLGKTIVAAKDTPNFIANRLGTFLMLNTFRIMQQQSLSIAEVDLLTGPILGWPKSGTFRLADMIGVDVLASVARNFAAGTSDERSDIKLPAVIAEMVQRNMLGDKTKQGFYKRARGEDGKEIALVLDLATLDYKPIERPRLSEIDAAQMSESIAERLNLLLQGDGRRGKAANFYWQALPELWAYAANRIGEIGDSILDLDRAMRAGYNWELGPFELWDAAGVVDTVGRMRAKGHAVPAAVEILLASGGTSWYRSQGREYFDPASSRYLPVAEPGGLATLSRSKRKNGVVTKNAGVSLVDLDDGIACIEFHSKMNSLGDDAVNFIRQTLDPGGDAVKKFEGFVVSNDAQNFSVGANLMLLLLSIQDGEWDEIDFSVRSFQAMTQAIKFSARPVVAAPFGLCLGGGTEIVMHAAACQAHIELYAGLVESSVGLLPAGGGCKEMTLRALAAADGVRADVRGESVEVHETLKQALETIAMAKISTSAFEARKMRILSSSDAITMNRERLVADAKARARHMADAGHGMLFPRTDIPAPGESVLATLKLGIYTRREGGFISEHDAKIAGHVAHVLSGGPAVAATLLSEQYLLDLEREAFLSLCGEPKTAERIAFTLKTGKPLRN
jgi:3-hydroxyacyl-CoA dehydrogenase